MSLLNTCRTCLQNIAKEPVPITSSLYEFLEKELRIHGVPRVHPQLELPQNVCFECFRNIIAFKRFYTQCRDAEEFLKIKLEIALSKQLNEEEIIQHDDFEVIEQIQPIENTEYDDMQITSEYNELEEDVELNENLDCIKNIGITFEEFNEPGQKYLCADSTVDSSDPQLQSPSKIVEKEDFDTNIEDAIIVVELDDCFDNEDVDTKTSSLVEKCSNVSETTESQDIEENNRYTRKRRFKCQFCEKCFSNRYDLQAHEYIHIGVKPFSCEVCGKSFRQKNVLRTHQALHFGKNIKCEKCGKSFARKSQLILHDRMHRNIKPFKCDFDEHCGAAFRERQHLVSHQKVHIGVREHQCEHCPSAFYHRKGLLSHMRDVHGKACYQCNICERSFKKPYKIRKHFQAVHELHITDVTPFRKNTDFEPSSEEADDVSIIYEEHLSS